MDELTDEQIEALMQKGWYLSAEGHWVDLGVNSVERFETECRGCQEVKTTYVSLAGLCVQCSVLKVETPGYPAVDAMPIERRYLYHLLLENLHNGQFAEWKMLVLMKMQDEAKSGTSMASRILGDATE